MVDVQNDFISGSLAISNYGEHQGEEVSERRLLWESGWTFAIVN